MAIAAGVLVIVAVFLWGYPGILMKGTVEYEKAALASYHQGDFDKALEACKIIMGKNAQVSLAYLIEGDVYFRRGDLDAAESAYKRPLMRKKRRAPRRRRPSSAWVV